MVAILAVARIAIEDMLHMELRVAVGVNQIYKQFSKSKAIATVEAFEELNGEDSEIDTEEDSEGEG